MSYTDSGAVVNFFMGWLGAERSKTGISVTKNPRGESCGWTYGNRFKIWGSLYCILMLTTEYLLQKSFFFFKF